MVGAGNGIRTRDFQLGKLTLYQLSYARGRERIVKAEDFVKRKASFMFQALNSD